MTQANYIAIRTCNRPAYLQRLLLSVSRRRAESPACVLVFDDSRDAAIRQRNEQIVQSAQRRFGFSARYMGKAWQESFIKKLIRLSPADAASIRWLLAERPAGEFTGGRLLNLIMLVLAGHRFTLFDDDYLLDRARHLGRGDSRKLVYSRDPVRDVLAHLSVAESRAAGQELETDPVEAHLSFLGRRVNDCLQPSAKGGESLLDASNAGTPPDRLALDKNSVILTTVNGQYGVPIAPNCFYLFYQAHGEAGPPWADPEHYRLLRKGRAIWNVTQGPVISGRTGSTPSAIDNRCLMPPTLPHCKGEDTLLCAMIKYLYPNAANLYLPWALEHSRKPVPWAYETFDRPQQLMLAKTVWKKVEDFSPLAADARLPEARLNLLSQYWLQWAAQPVDILREELRESFVRGVRWRITVMSECLDQIEDSHSQVHKDLSRSVKQFKSDLAMKAGLPAWEENPAIEDEIKRIEWMAGTGHDLGRALGAWSRLWQVAKDMNALAR
jgi:hypothetical protein